MEKINLQKFIAASGFCSRRAAEALIRVGRITLNGKKAVVTDRVAENDRVLLDGRELNLPTAQHTILLHKPTGYTCTRAQFPGEKNIFTLLPQTPRFFAVGRLDKDSSGMLVLTTDGALAQQLMHPKFEHEKEYEVTTKNDLTHAHVHQLQKGVDIGRGDGFVRAKKITLSEPNTLHIVLTEGKKRQIRRMLAAVHLGVSTLKRIRIGQLRIGKIQPGSWRALTQKEIDLLKKKELPK